MSSPRPTARACSTSLAASGPLRSAGHRVAIRPHRTSRHSAHPHPPCAASDWGLHGQPAPQTGGLLRSGRSCATLVHEAGYSRRARAPGRDYPGLRERLGEPPPLTEGANVRAHRRPGRREVSAGTRSHLRPASPGSRSWRRQPALRRGVLEVGNCRGTDPGPTDPPDRAL